MRFLLEIFMRQARFKYVEQSVATFANALKNIESAAAIFRLADRGGLDVQSESYLLPPAEVAAEELEPELIETL